MQTLSPLERCISPFSLEEFLNQYWEKTPFISLGLRSQESFGDLLSMSAVDKIISSSNLKYPFFRLIKGGDRIPVEQCTTEWVVGADRENGLADLNVVYDQYANGATVELQVMERNCLSLMRFCNLLEKQLGCPTRAIIYLTPESSGGFPAHYDTHDTIILQVAGAKRWKIWRDPVRLPLPTQYDTGNNDLVREEIKHPPLYEITMRPGDSIYLPRGYIHQAFTDDTYSLSISIGVMVHRLVDVLAELVKETLILHRTDARYQQGIFKGSSPSQVLRSPETHEVFDNLIDDFMSEFNFERGKKLVMQRFISSRRPCARGRLLDIEAVNQISLETTAFKRLELISCLTKDTDSVTLHFQGAEEVFDISLWEALQFIDNKDAFRVGEIPGNIPDKEKLAIVTRLLKHGYLTLQNEMLGIAVQGDRHNQEALAMSAV